MQAFRFRAATVAVAVMAVFAGGCGGDAAEETGTELPGELPGLPTASPAGS